MLVSVQSSVSNLGTRVILPSTRSQLSPTDRPTHPATHKRPTHAESELVSTRVDKAIWSTTILAIGGNTAIRSLAIPYLANTKSSRLVQLRRAPLRALKPLRPVRGASRRGTTRSSIGAMPSRKHSRTPP